MIEYILISYVLMFVWCLKWVLFDYDDTKMCFKIWVMSPLSLPLNLIIAFMEW